ncbi:hypothetical protein ACXOLC_05605, partial [Streptococcus thermophilus]
LKDSKTNIFKQGEVANFIIELSVIWGLLLFTADSLADIDNYDQRDWGSEAFDKALELCLDIIVQM